jgi:hypothetical protein
MKSNKKCVFNVNFQYNHKQVPTAYFSMMFNIHKHISHLIFVLVPECGEYEKKTRRTQCTIRSAVNHLQNLFNVKTVSWKRFKFYSRSKTTTITNFILDEISPQFTRKYRKQNKQPKRKLVRQIILEINSLDM